jgi:hypothetical protein
MKSKMIFYKLACLAGILTVMGLKSCRPDYCAECYDYSGVFRNKAMVICADNPDELDLMMEDAEYSLGYVCKYK